MPKFSANLGFLWKELPLPEAIRQAGKAGFDAVECHWPYDQSADLVNAALAETGLKMLSINTAKGNVNLGEFGLAALPGRQKEAKASIDQAIGYAKEIGAGKIHVLAGITQEPRALEVFEANLDYACKQAELHGLGILIEPLNKVDVPGYFLNDVHQACDIIDRLELPNLKLMFDCYHIAKSNLPVLETLRAVFDSVGHVQFASTPDRGSPDKGDIDFVHIFQWLDTQSYSNPLGAEYICGTDMAKEIIWLKDWKETPSA